MTWWIAVLIIYGGMALIVDLAILAEFGKKMLDETLNPICIYYIHKVNIFGCVLLAILGHLLLPWIAPFYWLYKLCTVGRR